MKYTTNHEWLKIEGDEIIVGITVHATEQLGDLVFIRLPAVGSTIGADEESVIMESVKTASAINGPVSGTVRAINQAIIDNPALVNGDPLGEGWFIRLKPDMMDDVAQFMDAAAYNALIGE